MSVSPKGKSYVFLNVTSLRSGLVPDSESPSWGPQAFSYYEMQQGDLYSLEACKTDYYGMLVKESSDTLLFIEF